VVVGGAMHVVVTCIVPKLRLLCEVVDTSIAHVSYVAIQPTG
jgi:hypothetical protein